MVQFEDTKAPIIPELNTEDRRANITKISLAGFNDRTTRGARRRFEFDIKLHFNTCTFGVSGTKSIRWRHLTLKPAENT